MDGGPPGTPSPIALAPTVTNNTLIQVGQLQVPQATAQGDLQLLLARGDPQQVPSLLQIQQTWEENITLSRHRIVTTDFVPKHMFRN